MVATRRRFRWEVPLAVVSATAVATGAVWINLIENQVTVGPSPAVSDGWVESELQAWYAWWATTMSQSRAALVVLIIGLIGVALTVLRATGSSWTSRSGAVAVAGAALTWCVADVAQAGAQRAVEQMTAYGNPIGAVASIAYATDVATSFVEAAATIALGLGAAAMGIGFWTERRQRLAVLSALVGATGAGFGVCILLPEANTTAVSVALGVVLLPIWLVAVSLARPAPSDAPSHSDAQSLTDVVGDH